MSESQWELQELRQWADWNRLHERLDDLLRPHCLKLPQSADALQRDLSALADRLPESHRHLPAAALVAAALGPATKLPSWLPAAVERLHLCQSLGLHLTWAELTAMPWAWCPIALAGPNGAAKLLTALLGLSAKPLPADVPRDWSAAADPAAREAVGRALKLIRRRTGRAAYFWPFLCATGTIQVYGGSLALPIALTGLGLAEGLRDPGLLATGGLDDEGNPTPVTHLEAKHRLAKEAGFAMLLCPRNAAVPQPDPRENGPELVAVDDLNEAYRLWRLHSETGGSRIQLFDACCRNPGLLADNLPRLDPCLLKSAAAGRSYGDGLTKLTTHPDHCLRLTECLESALKRKRSCWDSLTELLRPLSPEVVIAAAEHSPEAAFRLAQVRLTLANHRGDLPESEIWCAVSDRLAAGVQTTERGWNLFFRYCNRLLIPLHHNRYRFEAQLPKAVATALETLEKLAQGRQLILPIAVDPELGAFHGTLAQHFGFCGAAGFARLEAHVQRAQEAFGGGRLPDLANDWRRQFNYLLYGQLDAARAGAADNATDTMTGGSPADPEETLNRYLDGDWRTVAATDPDRLDRFQHAALARFLADREEPFGPLLHWAERHLDDRPRVHPWQLWLHNIGRLLPKQADRRRAWRAALQQCRQSAATIRIMALLPLASLFADGAERSECLKATRSLLVWLPASGLDTAHFAPLLDAADAETVLRRVAAEPERFFPFSYR